MAADGRGQTISCDACSRQPLNDVMSRKQMSVHDCEGAKTLVCVIKCTRHNNNSLCDGIYKTPVGINLLPIRHRKLHSLQNLLSMFLTRENTANLHTERNKIATE